MNLVSLIVSVVTALIGYALGYRQGKISQRALDLSIVKAAPKVGTTVRIDKRQENPPAFPPFYYLVATIYNEGELPAKQLKGHCKLHSPVKSVQERDIPFNREFLGSTPYELESFRLDSGISGTPIDIGASGGQNIRFNVDVEFEYFGIPDDAPQHYSAKYQYNNQRRQLERI